MNLFRPLGTCVVIAMLIGCAAEPGTPLSPSPVGITAERTRASVTVDVLHFFRNGSGDGVKPSAGLLNLNGMLYGTTRLGGANRHPYGIVFSITTSGKETVLHSFGGVGDGGYPQAGLLNVNGTLYGTTYIGGGAYNFGTVFAITPSGAETVLHRFGRGSEGGAHPQAGLVNVKGMLYGTTVYGGANTCSGFGCGTVYAVTRSGTENVIHSFGGSGDGEFPEAGLVNVNGTLYGTTTTGGSYCRGSGGCGTVFSITPSGKETVLYSFSGKDGAHPRAALLNVKGMLYGTTTTGGKYCAAIGGCGTVFSITTSGKEIVLHSFGGTGDGTNPRAGLLNVNGMLYGTTAGGGANGRGTIFSIAGSGAESVLYSFKGNDGKEPSAALLNVKGRLYGTAEVGGASGCGVKGCGTVFSLSP
jgi:uncharacterized repeat protein (TIGR03803 family)